MFTHAHLAFCAAGALLLASCATVAGPGGSSAAAPPGAEQAEIHFANLGGIYSWQADGESALYIQGRDRKWYHARLLGPCMGLPFATRVGFVSEPSGTFDRFSAILVDHRECQVTSLVRSEAPAAGK